MKNQYPFRSRELAFHGKEKTSCFVSLFFFLFSSPDFSGSPRLGRSRMQDAVPVVPSGVKTWLH
jgi:hypothetical protein